jgi:DNA-binding response OmpR family regulator
VNVVSVTGRDSSSPHILVVEDDPNTADMLIAYFSSLGYQVSHAAWGKDALNIASESLPDLVLLDIHLPDIDGYEVCMRLRSQRRTERTPIVFLTERRERMDRLNGLDLGAVDYITKPFDVQEMRYRIRNILRRSLDTFLHPVTGLPTSVLVEEQLERVQRDRGLSFVGLELTNMQDFSEAYGFVTHDDVLRAMVLILRNTVAEVMSQDPFVGQVEVYKFLLVVPSDQRTTVMERLTQRLNEALSFFYPHRDWEMGKLEDGQPLPKIGFKLYSLPYSKLPQEWGLAQLTEELFRSPRS